MLSLGAKSKAGCSAWTPGLTSAGLSGRPARPTPSGCHLRRGPVPNGRPRTKTAQHRSIGSRQSTGSSAAADRRGTAAAPMQASRHHRTVAVAYIPLGLGLKVENAAARTCGTGPDRTPPRQPGSGPSRRGAAGLTRTARGASALPNEERPTPGARRAPPGRNDENPRSPHVIVMTEGPRRGLLAARSVPTPHRCHRSRRSRVTAGHPAPPMPPPHRAPPRPAPSGPSMLRASVVANSLRRPRLPDVAWNLRVRPLTFWARIRRADVGVLTRNAWCLVRGRERIVSAEIHPCWLSAFASKGRCRMS